MVYIGFGCNVSACLFLFGLLYSILTNFEHIVKNAEQKMTVSAMLELGLSDDRINEIRMAISRRDEVKKSSSFPQRIHGSSLPVNMSGIPAFLQRILLRIVIILIFI